MAQPALIFWLLGLPILLAIVELFRTYGLIRNSTRRERGVWSQATYVGGASPGATVRSAPGPSAAGRPSTPSPGLR